MSKVALFTGLLLTAGAAALVLTSCLGASATEIETTGCPPIDPGATDSAFNSVSEVMERRCGTLDCHGQSNRPLRIYGATALRRPEPDIGTDQCENDNQCPGENRKCQKGLGCIDKSITDYSQYFPGGSVSTTPSERRENWTSMCSIEPEIITLVYCCSSHRCKGFNYAADCTNTEAFDPKKLTLIRKARLQEKHKGGLIWNEGDPGDVCMTTWVTGGYDVTKSNPNPKADKCEEELAHQ